ncbi:MAG TPA: LysM domain-containing protein [Tepidisphaeraceae bacterium]|nr:LysM domain-containing protein [Tepidisphaeraceae bacterium]
MRKDVKIGLAIGGVLLAVLIVYLLVPKDPGKSEQYGQADPSNTLLENNPGNGRGSEADSGAATDGAFREAARPSDQPPSTGGQTDTSPTVTDAGNAGINTGVSTEGDDPSDAPRGKFDWTAMLNNGVMPDKLVAVTPQTQSGQAPGAPGEIPQKDPFARDPEPNWTEGGVAQGPTGTQGQGQAGPGTQAPTQQQATTPATTSGGVREHTVQPGETLSSIALATYGESRHYLAIEKANPDLDPKRMRPGMKIKLPDPAAVKAEVSARAVGPARQTATQQQATIDPAREYRVQPGDSLYKISLRLYGRGDKADALYQANRAAIGDDSARLKVGAVIKLPEAPTASPTATR